MKANYRLVNSQIRLALVVFSEALLLLPYFKVFDQLVPITINGARGGAASLDADLGSVKLQPQE